MSNSTTPEATVPDIDLERAWAMLADDESAVLLDVRTSAEWAFVGLPDISGLGRELRTVEWSTFPDGRPNPDFLTQATAGLEVGRPILILCRSGVRSLAAGQLLAANGFGPVFNVVAGFEGDLDERGHRHGGWKEHLPWRQG